MCSTSPLVLPGTQAAPIGIRRSHHLAFKVEGIEEVDAAEAALQGKGIPYGRATVPGSEPAIVQLFLFDPDVRSSPFPTFPSSAAACVAVQTLRSIQ